MNSNTLLSEFEWYVRDYFFRMNNKSEEEFKEIFEINEIASYLHENYFRYKTWRMDEINEMLNKVISIFYNKNVLTMVVGCAAVKLHSKLERKQCVKCFYINYLSINEAENCLRCMSEDLKQFIPPRRKKNV